MSAPAPGPNGMMNRTGCCGQACVCACAGGTATARIATRVTREGQSFDISFNNPRKVTMRGNASRSIEEAQRSLAGGRIRPAATMFRTRGHMPSGLELTEKANGDARDRVDLERDSVLAR